MLPENIARWLEIGFGNVLLGLGIDLLRRLICERMRQGSGNRRGSRLGFQQVFLRGNSSMSMQQQITGKLQDGLQPLHLEVSNESHMHNVPPGSESHFKILIAAEQFAGKSLLQRHRLVNAALKDELAGQIHALALHTLTPDEWFERAGVVPDSPPCLGGGKG